MIILLKSYFGIIINLTKGGKPMQRTVLVTEFKHPETGATATVYGSRDSITATKRLLAQGYEIKDTYSGLFEMDEKTFVKNATLKIRK